MLIVYLFYTLFDFGTFIAVIIVIERFNLTPVRLSRRNGGRLLEKKRSARPLFFCPPCCCHTGVTKSDAIVNLQHFCE